jgi:ornithine cyclodeaminase/alanine dehydrogenase-like protein (mu-crystallin family)
MDVPDSMDSTMPMRFVSAADCERLLGVADVVAQVRRALEWERQGRITWPKPRSLNILGDEHGNHFHVKACVLEDVPIAGIRMVSHPGDDDGGGGTRLILLVDPTTTKPVALVDESWSYGQRTVASIALASAAVAASGASTLAMVGSGHLARLALTYYAHLIPGLRGVRVTSRRPERRAAFAAWARETCGLEATDVASVAEAVAGADLVLTCTSAGAPLVEAAWIEPGTVVAALDTVELSPGLVRTADVLLVDSREQLRAELIECYGEDAPDRVSATFADVLAGAHPGRTRADERIVLVSQGLASQDVALAHLAYSRASERDGALARPAA